MRTDILSKKAKIDFLFLKVKLSNQNQFYIQKSITYDLNYCDNKFLKEKIRF
jgi:hypothetical protein